MNNQECYRILYKKHKTGKIGYWSGWVEPTTDRNWTMVMEYASGPGDSPQKVYETIRVGKQGRSIKEQAVFRLDSRTSNKLDAGYVYDYQQAESAAFVTDALGNVKPMLAQKFKDFKGVLDENRTWMQLKYNGHRCLIINNGQRTFAVSRNGKEIPGIPHILENIRLPEGEILDGEIYRHGWKLQTIASNAKKYQPTSKELSYVAYDRIDTDAPFLDRFSLLKEFQKDGLLCDGIKIAPTITLANQKDSITESLSKAISRGYEGLILRTDGVPYEIGRRSSSLLKVKQLMDQEFKVVDVLASKDGWGILVCELPNSTFKVSAPGTITDKIRVLERKNAYIGRTVTVEFSEWTQDKKPFHPVALHWQGEVSL
jgi:ATP-dependent DNA ligase